MLCLRGCRELSRERELKSLSPVYGRQEVKLWEGSAWETGDNIYSAWLRGSGRLE
jgi:hypothetical protein